MLYQTATEQLTHRFSHIKIATTFKERLQGLLVFKQHPEQLVYVIPQCKMVHTYGMSYPIDIVFIDRCLRIVHIKEQVSANAICVSLEASHTLELNAGGVAYHKLKLGDRLCSVPFSNIAT